MAKITGQGLFAIGCAVALLWMCLIGERVVMQRAWEERAQVMRSIERGQRKRHSQPVSDPLPLTRRERKSLG